MYLQYFGLEANPFSLTPDPRFLFLTPKHREALAGLLFAVTARKGFLVLTGEAGTGKTTLVRKLLQSIPSTCAHLSVIVNPALTPAEFLEHLLTDFGVAEIPQSKAARLFILKKLLLKAYRDGKTSVLVIDEAHLLSREVMEEVRLLSNFETSEEKLLQVILAGQEELKELLDLESMRQLKQRISVRLSIDRLDRQDVKRYIQARWTRAGGKNPHPFSDQALELIGSCSRGTPRVVNAVCDAALLNAYGAGLRSVGPQGIAEVMTDLHLAGNESAPVAAPLPPVPAAMPPVAQAKPAVAPPPRIPVFGPAAPFKSLERYMPDKIGPRLFRWTSWFTQASGVGAK
jgi:general secretion pathway protein A